MTLLLRGGRIVEPTVDRVTEPMDIAIDEDTIVALAPAGTMNVDPETTVLDVGGRYVLPGLIDVHAHIGDGGLGDQTEADRVGALAQFLHYGVTTIFAPGGGGGNDDQLAVWKAQCRAGTLQCPRLFGSGALITAPGSHPIGTIWEMPADVDPATVYARGAVTVADEAEIEALIEHKHSMGADAIKIVIEDWLGEVPRLSNALIRGVTEAAHARGLRVFAHISGPQHAADGVAAGIDGVMHSSEGPIDDALFAEMARRGVYYVATLSLYDGFFDRAGGENAPEPYAARGASPRALASLERFGFSPFTAEQARETLVILEDNLRRAAAAGVPLAVGSDVNNPSVFPGYSAHEELELMVESGLSPAQALAAATVGGAAFLERESTLGRVAAGYRADLLVLDRNPLESILNTRSIHAVIHQGKKADRVVTAPSATLTTE